MTHLRQLLAYYWPLALLLCVIPIRIYSPALSGGYVQVPQSIGSISIQIPGSVRELTLSFSKDVDVVGYDLTPMALGIELPGLRTRHVVGSPTSALAIVNALPDVTTLSARPTDVKIDIQLRLVDPLEITAVTFDSARQDLRSFSDIHLLSNSDRYLRVRYFQDDISTLVARWNTEAGNWLLGIMVALLLWLLSEVVGTTKDSYWTADDALLHRFTGGRPVDNWLDLRASVHDSFDRYWNITQFLQVCGPALGFLLTVTSLVAGLRPSFQNSDRQLSLLFDSLQLAMTSTVLGLLIRITALSKASLDERNRDRVIRLVDGAQLSSMTSDSREGQSDEV